MKYRASRNWWESAVGREVGKMIISYITWERLKAGGRNEDEVRRSVVRRKRMTAAEKNILEEMGTSS